MLKPLIQLPRGTRFQVPGLDIEATLVSVNECRARVKIDRGERHVLFTSPDGTEREFTARDVRTTSWTPALVVEVIEIPEVK